MGLRPAKCYRNVKRPFTRVSKFKKKSFVSGVPGMKIVRFETGNKGEYDHVVELKSTQKVQIRHNALEAGRVTANKFLTRKVPGRAFLMKIKVYPHHIMRENPIAGGAGADRFTQGMSKPYGKPIGRAAQVSEGQVVYAVHINEQFVSVAKEALRKTGHKLPCKTKVTVKKKS